MARTDRTLSNHVLSAVANETGKDPRDLPILHNAISVDELNNLFQAGTIGHITFEYSGFDVTVDSDGDVTLAEHDPEQPRSHSAEPATAD